MGDPTIIGMIHESVQNIEKDIKTTNNQVVKNQLDIEKNNGRLYTQEAEIENIKAAREKVDKHIIDKEIHFDKEKAQTTTLGYWAKKKVLIILITALAGLISAVTGVLMFWINNLGGT